LKKYFLYGINDKETRDDLITIIIISTITIIELAIRGHAREKLIISRKM